MKGEGRGVKWKEKGTCNCCKGIADPALGSQLAGFSCILEGRPDRLAESASGRLPVAS